MHTLSLSEKGTQDQQEDIVGLVAVASQMYRELEDIASGTRDPKLHPHHQPKDLARQTDSAVRHIRKICREIDPNAKLPEILPPIKK